LAAVNVVWSTTVKVYGLLNWLLFATSIR